MKTRPGRAANPRLRKDPVRARTRCRLGRISRFRLQRAPRNRKRRRRRAERWWTLARCLVAKCARSLLTTKGAAHVLTTGRNPSRLLTALGRLAQPKQSSWAPSRRVGATKGATRSNGASGLSPGFAPLLALAGARLVGFANGVLTSFFDAPAFVGRCQPSVGQLYVAGAPATSRRFGRPASSVSQAK